MLVVPVVSIGLGATAYVVAPHDDGPALVIDPGFGVAADIAQVCAAFELSPQAVLLTHGHLDHWAGADQVCSQWDVECWIHPADRYRLLDPFRTMSAPVRDEFARIGGLGIAALASPVHEYAMNQGRGFLSLAGIDVELIHAPGHTEGSSLVSTKAKLNPRGLAPRDASSGETYTVVFTGDVLFDGSVGRTDLPGGDNAQMRDTLREIIGDIPDEAIIMPGHGTASTMQAQRQYNPYL